MDGIVKKTYKYQLSILVPVYNVENYLQRCIDSLVGQDIPTDEYEIILVNDGSKDDSLHIIRDNAAKYSNIKYIDKENGGLSSARNAGIAAAQGEYIMHVDADDFIERNVVGQLIASASKYQAELCFFLMKTYPERGGLRNRQPFKLNTLYTGRYILLHGMKVSSSWSCIYSHDFIKKSNLRYYGRISHQDVEYNYRLYPKAERVIFTDIYVYNYNVENESITRTTNIQKIQKKIFDDMVVAANIIEYTKDNVSDVALKNMILTHMNSVIISTLLQALKNRKLEKETGSELVAFCQERNIYPIIGITNSWKTTYLKAIFNLKFIYKTLYRLTH